MKRPKSEANRFGRVERHEICTRKRSNGTCSERSEELMFLSKIKKRCFQTGATSLKLIGRMLIELRKICGSDVWKEIKVKKYDIENNS